MIPVAAVRPPPQHRTEGAAGGAVHPAQRPAPVAAAPVLQDVHFATVAQADRRDVDGPTLAMLADLCAGLVVAGTAGVCAATRILTPPS